MAPKAVAFEKLKTEDVFRKKCENPKKKGFYTQVGPSEIRESGQIDKRKGNLLYLVPPFFPFVTASSSPL